MHIIIVTCTVQAAAQQSIIITGLRVQPQIAMTIVNSLNKYNNDNYFYN